MSRLLTAEQAVQEWRRPYSPKTLGERWGCSAEKIRQMYHNGELAGFELGKLIRIRAVEVERIECQNTASSNTETSGASPTPTPSVDGLELRLAKISVGPQRLSLVESGESKRALGRKG